MRFRTPAVLIVGAISGGVAGWLLFCRSIVRDDMSEGVGMVLIGVVMGCFFAVMLLTGGTGDFRSNKRPQA